MAQSEVGRIAGRHDGGEVRVQRVVRHAFDVFEDEAVAAEWLHDPNPALDGRVPIETARTEEGERLIHTLLGRIEHGVYT